MHYTANIMHRQLGEKPMMCTKYGNINSKMHKNIQNTTVYSHIPDLYTKMHMHKYTHILHISE